MESDLPVADSHVHTEWSWDAARGSMRESCQRAIQLGLPAIAFTDHADFTAYVRVREGLLDIAGYHRCLEICRAEFPELRILSGVELGEPHLHAEEAEVILGAGKLERVLGSVHCLQLPEGETDASTPGLFTVERAPDLFREYLAETLRLVESASPFEVLAHLDYPKRYWPHDQLTYNELDYQEEFRAVLSAAARRGSVLEVNTTRGMEPQRGLCPGPLVLGWWREVGGTAVSLGSDAHNPDKIAAGFKLAVEVLESAGFSRPADPLAYWLK
ncbi:MAG TPA: histidinol-phosphatase HisJ family protein [Candidatus Dormibacteraeota bacterium]|nr:histidinol-phosphatase HisJ family protein [Candidatus Dormibacteraeota bacterium]